MNQPEGRMQREHPLIDFKAEALYETKTASVETKEALLRIEAVLKAQSAQQTELMRRMDQHLGNIKSMVNWCGLAALVYLGLLSYHYFFK